MSNIRKNFVSDNVSGVHPKVMEALIKCNEGHMTPYGGDELSLEAAELIKKELGAKAVYFTLNGTGTNICILDALTAKYGAIMCTDLCHVFIHEAGAAAKTGQMQILTVSTDDGKLNPKSLDKYLQYKSMFHFPQPQVITISQTTEMGTVYTVQEIKDLVAYAKEHGYKVHMDGSRISNACASLGISLKEMTCDLGIDALSFGMSKNGMMFGECAVFFDDEHPNFMNLMKANLQVQSKSRYVGAQYLAMMKDNLWLENATKANEMAKYLCEGLEKIDGINIVASRDSNMVFVEFPKEIIKPLQDCMLFFIEYEDKNYSRLVCNFDTTKEDIDKFVAKARELMA